MDNQSIARKLTGSENGRIRTLIVGAGIAGLTLAALLKQRGENPVIIDREENLDHLGYHLALYPHGARVLHGLGLYEKYRAETIPMYNYNIYNGHGQLIHDFSLQELNDRYGPVHGITRKQLIDLLIGGTGSLKIKTGTTLKSIRQEGEEVKVTFHDDSEASFDLVVAADGLHSETREMVLDKDEYSYFETGWGGWLFWVDPTLGPANTVTEYWGSGRFIWMYPVKDYLGVFLGGPVDKLKKEGVSNFAEHVREQFGMFDGQIKQILDSNTIGNNPFFWDFHDCRVKHWSKGRVVFLGDAADGFLPTAGVGASMAMESAAALNDELSRTDAHFVEQALMLFEKRHRRRVEAAQDNSRGLAKLIFIENLPLAWTRDQAMKFFTVEMLIKDIARSIDEPI